MKMIGIEDSRISCITHHKVSPDETEIILSNSILEYSEESEINTLKKAFLKPFMTIAETFEFHHDVDLDYNVLFQIIQNIEMGDDFAEGSYHILQHLISCSRHPNIKGGDVFTAMIEEVQYNNQIVDAIGIFKFEEKDQFIDTSVKGNRAHLTFRKVIGSKKPDKGCLILLTDAPYTILIIDNPRRETDYWQNEFINHKPKADHVNNTNQTLSMTKEFINSRITEEFEVSKADQIDYLNRSVDYFKSHDNFDKNEFEENVFRDEGVIQSFQEFDQNYRKERDLQSPDHFEISPQAVKKQARAFKSVLKLDKNFHIYIHGNREWIEQGVDENGRKFYKIYYEKEQ